MRTLVLAIARHVPLAVFAAILAGGAGCFTKVILKSPDHGKSLQVGKAPGPFFAWTAERRTPFSLWLYGGEPGLQRGDEYTLTVSRDVSFGAGSTVYRAERIQERGHMIPPEQGWLASGKTYHWKVDGMVREEDGTISKEYECKAPRAFTLQARETVAVDLKLPKSTGGKETQVNVGDETFTGDASFSLEFGEMRKVAIHAWDDGQPITAGGNIWVVNVNENTKFGRIIIDKLDLEALKQINKGEVADFTFSLGGAEIVKMKLGSRID